LLGGGHQGGAHIPKKLFQTPAALAGAREVVGEGAGMTKIHQIPNLLRGEAEQVLISVMGDLHEP
jgi:hypothetical protein